MAVCLFLYMNLNEKKVEVSLRTPVVGSRGMSMLMIRPSRQDPSPFSAASLQRLMHDARRSCRPSMHLSLLNLATNRHFLIE